MKKIILNNFKEQAYIECVKDKGYYSDLEVIFNVDNIRDSDEVVSINNKYKINYVQTLKEAIEKLKLNWFIIKEEDIKDKSIELAVS
jgi:hypothetical protein